jgi:hypothetical protein
MIYITAVVEEHCSCSITAIVSGTVLYASYDAIYIYIYDGVLVLYPCVICMLFVVCVCGYCTVPP